MEVAAQDEVIAGLAGAVTLEERVRLAKALYARASRLANLGRYAEALAAYEDIDRRFDDAWEPDLRTMTVRALSVRVGVLGALGRPDEAVMACTQVERRAGSAIDTAMRRAVVGALSNKGALCGQLAAGTRR